MTRVFIIACLLVFSACEKDKTPKLVLEEVMAEKKKKFLEEKKEECKQKAFEEARQYVDSLANKWVQDDLLDTIDFPSRPVRPERPEDILEKH